MQPNFLNWSDGYLKACEKFGTTPQIGLESFIECLSPIVYFTSLTGSSTDIAMSIFEIFEKTKPKYVVNEVTKQTHLDHINKLQVFITTKSNQDLEEYLESIDVWYDDVKLTLPSLQINTSNGSIIEISKDCSLLCDCMGCLPVEVLQYYVDHVDYKSVDSQMTLATEFFVKKIIIENRLQ